MHEIQKFIDDSRAREAEYESSGYVGCTCLDAGHCSACLFEADLLKFGPRFREALAVAVRGLERAKLATTVPAAEYVPAIPDGWKEIDDAITAISAILSGERGEGKEST